jgi:hypothetical protein
MERLWIQVERADDGKGYVIEVDPHSGKDKKYIAENEIVLIAKLHAILTFWISRA